MGLARAIPQRAGIDMNAPSSCSTTTTSIAPERVDGLMEFHVFDTEPDSERTYCISSSVSGAGLDERTMRALGGELSVGGYSGFGRCWSDGTMEECHAAMNSQ